jgi:hypothetical protein
MTAGAKRQLSSTIRALRQRLLDDLHAATESSYRLSLRPRDAGLSEAPRTRRARLEEWLKEQVRAEGGSGTEHRTAEDFRREVEKQAAYTLLNRLVLLRLMEAPGPDGPPLRPLPVVTGGWESRAYKDFRELAPALVWGDETEGYAFLLQLVFEELATDLPGLFGSAGIADLVPIPASTLRHTVEALDDPGLASCWRDDMTLGWVYQYWNDPEREALDAKLNDGGKVEPHEIASKTQMFTERYIVDWLLQNSLGPMWLALCRKHGWTPEAESTGVLAALEERRVAWRAKREAGEVELTALMPLRSPEEERWAYYVPQPLPEDAVEHAPETVRDLKILDPAVGSGHFLVVAFDLLLALYREEARHRGEAAEERWGDRAVVERILEHNLHGIDLDPRAVQIAAAALWLKARWSCPEAHPRRLNLVASHLRLGDLGDEDPALVELRREVEAETGIPGELTDTLLHALRGADHLGSLLKVDAAVDAAIREHEDVLGRRKVKQGDLWGGFGEEERVPVAPEEAKATVLEKIERFLSRHGSGDDLGLRLRGEQLAAGVRFLRLLRENTYDLVVGNPPYQGTSKMRDAKYVQKHYPRGKADLYAAFLERALELTRPRGTSALLTMRNWMFIKQYSALREWLLETWDLRALGDFDKGAFESMPTSQLISICLTVLRRSGKRYPIAVAIQPTAPGEKYWSRDRTELKRAAVLCHVGRYEFDSAALKVVPEWPLIYWWDSDLLADYCAFPKLGEMGPGLVGLRTSDNTRFLRKSWEIKPTRLLLRKFDETIEWESNKNTRFAPYIKGARGREWFDDASDITLWHNEGL